MKIKHWQGYGSVNAKVVKRTASTKEGIKTITIEVVGNHEYGLDRHHDKYDVYNWLLKRFDKNVEDSRDILKIDYSETSIKIDNCDVDKATYVITYKWNAYYKGSSSHYLF